MTGGANSSAVEDGVVELINDSFMTIFAPSLLALNEHQAYLDWNTAVIGSWAASLISLKDLYEDLHLHRAFHSVSHFEVMTLDRN